MAPVVIWTGLEANVLRGAMRLSLRGFAEHLGVSLGTVSTWNRRGATVQPTPEMQSILDATLARATDEARERFADALKDAVGGGGDARAGSTSETSDVSRPTSHEVLLTVHIDGRSVTLPLDSVADAARAARAGPVSVGRELMMAGHGRWPMRAFESNDERAYELFVRGYRLLGGNDRSQIDAAQALLQQAVNRDPRFARAIAARGYASWRQYFAGWSGRSEALQDALRDVEVALEVDPGSVGAHTTFIRACWDIGWHEKALEAGRTIYARNPESLDATVAFARSLNNAGLSQYALPLLAKVLIEDPWHLSAVKLTVWCRLMVEDYAGAVDTAREHLVRMPNDANTRWAVALAESRLPNGAHRAMATARAGLAVDPGDVTLWVLLGYLHRNAGDEEGAQESWHQGLRTVPAEANLRTLAWRANLLAAVGDRAGADHAVDTLVSVDPHNGYLRYRMAHVLAENGRAVNAVDMFSRAVDEGFLSVQLLRQELALGLVSLKGMTGFLSTLHTLDTAVNRCQRQYATDLPAAPTPGKDFRA
jgi:tetratricopeptide (TPR) repeat protein